MTVDNILIVSGLSEVLIPLLIKKMILLLKTNG